MPADALANAALRTEDAALQEETAGLHERVRETLDFLVSIPVAHVHVETEGIAVKQLPEKRAILRRKEAAQRSRGNVAPDALEQRDGQARRVVAGPVEQPVGPGWMTPERPGPLLRGGVRAGGQFVGSSDSRQTRPR